MEVHRISLMRHIRDLTGEGARLYGGRWNYKGTGVLYTSGNRALAVLEYLVHVPLSLVPAGLAIATLRISESVFARRSILSLSELPKNWKNYPAPPHLADAGTAWAKKNGTLLLQVPSAVVEREFNVLINPLHPDMKQVAITRVEVFAIDDRLLRKKKN